MLISENIFKWAYDVRVWILILLLIRLENINLPPVDEHNYRQTLTLMVARNLLEISPNPLQATISFGQGSNPSHVAMEPGIYTSLIAISYKIFGEHNWNSRLINLLISSFGLWFFYQFLRLFWDKSAALSSTVFFATSAIFIYSRKSMPDTIALSFVLMGIYYGSNFIFNNRNKDLYLYIITLSIGLLVKLPMICAAALLVAPLLQNKFSLKIHGKFLVVSVIPFTLMCLWYFYWIPESIKNGAMQMYETYGFREGWRQFWQLREGVWNNFSHIQMKSYIPFALLIPGFFALGWHRQIHISIALLCSAILFTIFIVQAAYAYPTHEYYGMPFNPAYAMIAGFGLAHLVGRWKFLLFLCLLLSAFIAIRNQKDDFFAVPGYSKFQTLGILADQVSTPNEKFLVNDAVYPRMLYFLHRSGRSEGNELFKKYPQWVYEYGSEGIKFICIERSTYPDSLPYPVAIETPDFRIYRHTWKAGSQ